MDSNPGFDVLRELYLKSIKMYYLYKHTDVIFLFSLDYTLCLLLSGKGKHPICMLIFIISSRPCWPHNLVPTLNSNRLCFNCQNISLLSFVRDEELVSPSCLSGIMRWHLLDISVFALTLAILSNQGNDIWTCTLITCSVRTWHWLWVFKSFFKLLSL